jgi:hypothetical protein
MAIKRGISWITIMIFGHASSQNKVIVGTIRRKSEINFQINGGIDKYAIEVT